MPSLYASPAWRGRGSGAEIVIARVPHDTFPLGWSPDARYIVGEQIQTAGNRAIRVYPQTEDRKAFPFVAARFNARLAKISPNGRWLAYSSDEWGRPEIYVETFPEHGGKW